MLNMGTVQIDSTIYIPIPTRTAVGAATSSGTLADGDFTFFKGGSTTATTIDAAAIEQRNGFGSPVAKTGRNQLEIDLSADADFTAGSYWQVWLSKSIDSTTIEECVAVFTIESEAQRGQRRLNEIYNAGSLLGASASHSTTAIDLTGTIDAQTPDDALNGEILVLKDATDDRWEFVRVTDFVNSTLVATVESLTGGVMSFTPAINDYCFRTGQVDPKYSTARALMDDTLTESYAGDGSVATAAQMLYLIQQVLTDFAVSSTTVSVKGLDGSTEKATLTLSDATNPTSITRAS